MERSGGSPFLRNVLVSALLFGLFSEWLRPLTSMADMTEVHRLYPFLGAIAFYMVLDTTSLRGWWSWPLKLIFTVGWIGFWFQKDLFFSGAWWMTAVQLAVEDAVAIAGGTWMVSPETRTFIFLVGWAALVYAVHRITVDRGQAMWFVASTMSFLVLLQLWPGLDTGEGVLRTAAMGLLLLTVQQGAKWERQLGSRFMEGRSVALTRLAVGILCGGIVLGSGYGLSAGASSEVKPISLTGWNDWLEAAAERRWSSSSTAAPAVSATTGYGGDSSRLGRSVTPNEGIAFEAVTARPTYWRGSTLDVYTGRGWRSSALSDTAEVFRSARAPLAGSAKTTLEQTVTVLDSSLEMNVFTGGAIHRFLSIEDTGGKRLSDIHIRFDPDSAAYFVGTNTVRLGMYRMETAPAEAEPEALLLDTGEVPSDPSERYLQLPDQLPDRVRALAASIVADVPADNRYLQAAAIEAYLKETYPYTMDTAVPPDGTDFVDQFLFETREGYCDHFSTAMVVLLRSIGIEARWVKGFAPGTLDSKRPDTYVVRHADAHSWVEVRFAGAGWVPFEPTPAAAFAVGAGSAAGASPEASASEPSGVQARLSEWLGEAEQQGAALWSRYAAAVVAAVAEVKERLPHEWMPLYAWGIAGAAGLAVGLYTAALLARALRRLPGGVVPGGSVAASRRLSPQQRRLDQLWRRIYRQHGGREAAETLREYAARMPAETPEARAALAELMRIDEAVRYGGASGKRVSRRWFDDVWRNIAK
jgi:transglutaminase-like putative cysteine protease